jgi:hypothetical protein
MKHHIRTGFLLAGIFASVLLGTMSCSINTDPYTFEQSTDPFDTLFLSSVFDVILQQGDHYGIEIHGTQEIAESVTFHIEDRTLFIENNDGPLWKHPELEPPIITLTFQSLSKVHADETCHIFSPDTIRMDTFGLTLGSKLNFADLKLDCRLFYYWNSSPVGGQIWLSGHSDFIRLYNGSLMTIDASQLSTHDALVSNGSKLDIHVKADQRLYYSISGTGNIYLTGHPADIEAGPVTSSGRLIQ